MGNLIERIGEEIGEIKKEAEDLRLKKTQEEQARSEREQNASEQEKQRQKLIEENWTKIKTDIIDFSREVNKKIFGGKAIIHTWRREILTDEGYGGSSAPPGSYETDVATYKYYRKVTVDIFKFEILNIGEITIFRPYEGVIFYDDNKNGRKLRNVPQDSLLIISGTQKPLLQEPGTKVKLDNEDYNSLRETAKASIAEEVVRLHKEKLLK